MHINLATKLMLFVLLLGHNLPGWAEQGPLSDKGMEANRSDVNNQEEQMSVGWENTDDRQPSDVAVNWVSEPDSLILVTLYEETDGDGWFNNENWLDGPVETWSGITVTDGEITMVRINANWLDGVIPPELGNLTNLEYLALAGNSFTGGIPEELGNLENLEHLDLENNGLPGEIPAELGNLSNLKYLDLRRNELSGEIPPEIGNLEYLEHLNFTQNNLTGELPGELANLSNLKNLYLGSNDFSGEIPDWLGNMANLEMLSLSGANFSGTIPPELGNLTNLKELTLALNELSGSIPPELSNLDNLTLLGLSHNNLSGPIPPEFAEFEKITEFLFDHNELEGAIPAFLGNMTQLRSLIFNNNRFSGEIPPELSNLVDLWNLNLSSNALEGDIPVELMNMESINSVNTGFSYNMLTAEDEDLVEWLEELDRFWESRQTVAPDNIEVNWQNERLASMQPQSGQNVEISWEPIAFSGQPGHYIVSYGTNPLNLEEQITTEDKTVESVTIEGLDEDAGYYFAVQTHSEPNRFNDNALTSPRSIINDAGEEVDLSPSVPQPVRPESESIIDEDAVTLAWGEADLAETYHFQMAQDESFEVLIVDEAGLESTEFEVTNLEGSTTYFWRVEAANANSTSGWSDAMQFTTSETVSAEDDPSLPGQFVLHPNFPNPFNPVTQIRYELPEQTPVRLQVYNLLGEHVTTLVNEVQSAGRYEISFDGSQLSSGTYLYRIEAGVFVASETMLMVK